MVSVACLQNCRLPDRWGGMHCVNQNLSTGKKKQPTFDGRVMGERSKFYLKKKTHHLLSRSSGSIVPTSNQVTTSVADYFNPVGTARLPAFLVDVPTSCLQLSK